MKLYCVETTVVKGGKIVERGQTHDTGDVTRKEDREAHDLIASGRMVQASDEKAVTEVKAQIEKEIVAKEQSKAEKKAAAAAAKNEK